MLSRFVYSFAIQISAKNFCRHTNLLLKTTKYSLGTKPFVELSIPKITVFKIALMHTFILISWFRCFNLIWVAYDKFLSDGSARKTPELTDGRSFKTDRRAYWSLFSVHYFKHIFLNCFFFCIGKPYFKVKNRLTGSDSWNMTRHVIKKQLNKSKIDKMTNKN